MSTMAKNFFPALTRSVRTQLYHVFCPCLAESEGQNDARRLSSRIGLHKFPHSLRSSSELLCKVEVEEHQPLISRHGKLGKFLRCALPMSASRPCYADDQTAGLNDRPF